MSKHTKGPWSRCCSNCLRVEDFRLDYPGEYASLIAAAPELLEALEELVRHNESTDFLNDPQAFIDAGEKARNAIKKAKGI